MPKELIGCPIEDDEITVDDIIDFLKDCDPDELQIIWNSVKSETMYDILIDEYLNNVKQRYTLKEIEQRLPLKP